MRQVVGMVVGVLVCASVTSVPSAAWGEEVDADRADRLAFFNQSLDTYRAVTDDGAPAQERAVAFMRRANERYVMSDRTATWEQAQALGQAAIKAGAKDPLVECYAVLAEWGVDGNLSGAQARLRKAWPRLKEMGYPVETRLMFGWLGMRLYNSRRLPGNEQKQARQWAEMLNDLVIEVLTSKAFEARFRTALADELEDVVGELDERYTKLLPDLLKRVEAAEGVDPWLRHVVLADLHGEVAWAARGGGVANTVKQEAWQTFAAGMDKAAEHYTAAWELEPQLPWAATAMIDVAKAGGGDQSPRVWFDRAVAGRIDHAPAYALYTAAIRPRWGGSYEQMEAFANECFESGRFDTNLPYRYVEVIDAIRRDAIDRNAAEVWKQPWREAVRYKRGTEVLRKLAEDPRRADPAQLTPSRSELLSELVLLAIRAEDYPAARRVIGELGDELDTGVFRSAFSHADYEVARAYARGGPHAEAFDLVWDLVDRDTPPTPAELETALTTLDTIRETSKDPRELTYERYLWERLEQIDHWDAGAWVDIPFDKPLLMWQPAFGEWEAQDDGSIIGTHPKAISRMSLFPRFGAKVQPPFEVMVTIEPVDGFAPSAYGYQAGVAVGELRPFTNRPPTGRVFFADPYLHQVGIVRGQRNWLTEPIPRADSIRLHVAVLGDSRFEIAANGVRSSFTWDESYNPSVRERTALNLGTMLFHHSEGQIRFRDFRVRRILTPNIPSDADAETKIAYCLARLKENRNSPVVASILAWKYYEMGKVEALSELYRRTLESNPADVSIAEAYATRLRVDGRPDEALAVLRDAVRRNDRNVGVTLKLVEMLAAAPIDTLRDGDEALRVADRAATLNGTFEDDMDVLIVRSKALAELGRYDEAVKPLDEVMKRVRSRWKAKIEDYAKFTGKLRQRYAAGKPWRNATDMRYLGYATYDGLNGERDFAAALAWFEAAYEIEPTDSAAVMMYLCQRRLGRDQPAQATLTTHRQAHPPEAWEAAVMRYLLGEIDDARLLELTEPGDAAMRGVRVCEAYFYIGTLKLLAGDRAAAVACFEKSRDTGETTYLTHRSAVYELKRLAKPQ